MLSSDQVSQLFAQQMQGMGAGNFYANTIGISNPALQIGSTGYWAGAGGMQPVGPQYPGMPSPPPVFNHGYGGFFGPGGGPGNRVATNVMSGMGAAAAAGSIGLGLASWMGPLKGIAPMIDPVSGFFAAGPKIPWLNPAGTGTIMSGLAGAIPGALVAGAGAIAMGSFMSGAHQQHAIGQQLGAFNFMNPSARTGQGFTRQDVGDVGAAIRQLAIIPEMLTNVEEITRLLPKFRAMGVMQGVRDAAEFNTRLKESIRTVADMARMLGTTMEEATKMFAHSRTVGMGSRSAQLANVMNLQFTSAFTGMSMEQSMGLQAQGAQMARQAGGRGRHGGIAALTMANRIQEQIERGGLDNDWLMDVGGAPGPEGVGSAAGRMTGIMNHLMSNTSAGQLVAAALMDKDANGKLVVNKKRLERFNMGGMGVDELKDIAMNRTEEEKILFKSAQGRNLTMKLAGEADMGSFVRSLMQTAGKGPGSEELVLHNMLGGMASDQEIEGILKLVRAGGIDSANFASIQQREMMLRERTDPTMILQRMKKIIQKNTTEPIKDLGRSVYNDIAKSVEDWIDDFVGRQFLSVSKQAAEAFQRAMSGGGDGDVKRMWNEASGLRSRVRTDDYVDPNSIGRWLGAMVRGVGNSSSTGRSLEGELVHQREQWGWVNGMAPEKYLAIAERGTPASAAGRAASEEYRYIRALAASKAGESGWAGTEVAKQADLLEEATTERIAKHLADYDPAGPVEGNEVLWTTIRTALDEGDYEKAAKLAGVDLGDKKATAESLGQALLASGDDRKVAAGKTLYAGGQAMRVLGINKLGRALSMVAGQQGDALDIKWTQSVSADQLARYRSVAGVKTLRDEAASGLSKYFGADAPLVRDNPAMARLFDAILNSDDPAKKDKLIAAVQANDKDALTALGHGDVKGTDLPSAQGILRRMNDGKSDVVNMGAAVRKTVQAESLAGIVSMQNRYESVGQSLVESVTKSGLGGAGGSALMDLGRAYKQYAAAGNAEQAGAAMMNIRANVAAVQKAYRDATPEERAKYRDAAPEIYKALEHVEKLRDIAAKNPSMTPEEFKKQFNVADEESFQNLAGAAVDSSGRVNLSGQQGEDIINRVSSSLVQASIARTGTGAGVSKEDQLIQTLQKMNTNGDLQNSLLAMLVQERGAWGKEADAANGLAQLRSNYETKIRMERGN